MKQGKFSLCTSNPSNTSRIWNHPHPHPHPTPTKHQPLRESLLPANALTTARHSPQWQPPTTYPCPATPSARRRGLGRRLRPSGGVGMAGGCAVCRAAAARRRTLTWHVDAHLDQPVLDGDAGAAVWLHGAGADLQGGRSSAKVWQMGHSRCEARQVERSSKQSWMVMREWPSCSMVQALICEWDTADDRQARLTTSQGWTFRDRLEDGRPASWRGR